MQITIPLLITAVIGGGLISASEPSLSPGGFLFPAKTLVENIRLGLADSNEEKINIYIKLADKRIAEINYILSQRKINSGGLEKALVSLENYILQSNSLLEAERRAGKDVSALSSRVAVSMRADELALKFQGYKLKAREGGINAAISEAESKGDDRSNILLAERRGFMKAKQVFDSEFQRMEVVLNRIDAARNIQEAEAKKQRLIEEARLRGVQIPISILLEIEDRIALADRAFLMDRFEEAEGQAFSARSTIRFLGTVLNRI